jgi:ADP-ribose pyrophosphatase YjhB (NUDIX family)
VRRRPSTARSECLRGRGYTGVGRRRPARWPGGTPRRSRNAGQAGVRETLEESGVECEITGLVGIYSDPAHVILYTSNGEARQEFSIVLTGRPLRGEPTPSSGTTEVRWVPVSSVAELTMDRSMRLRINDYLANKKSPVVI